MAGRKGRRALLEVEALEVLTDNPGAWRTSKTIYENICTKKDFLFRWNVRSMYVVLAGMYRKGMLVRRPKGNKYEYSLPEVEEE
jgi:predicted transcriptional regulator